MYQEQFEPRKSRLAVRRFQLARTADSGAEEHHADPAAVAARDAALAEADAIRASSRSGLGQDFAEWRRHQEEKDAEYQREKARLRSQVKRRLDKMTSFASRSDAV